VVGDRHVLVATLPAGQDHLLQGVLPVAPGAVHLEVAADVAEVQDLGKGAFLGGPHLAPVLSQLRRGP
jgi:hypothetical protein